MYSVEELQNIAKEVRKGIIDEIYSAKSGHPGGALSCCDILTTLYFNTMNISPKEPNKKDRDRLILSKGHASAALYAVLAQRGYFDKKELKTFRKLHSNLQGHPSQGMLPGIDASTGSLGQGLSIGAGMAMAEKIDNAGYYTYVVLGDGELQEGQIWESAMSIAHYKLNKLITFIDNNNLQICGKITDVNNPEPIKDKFEAFGFNVIEIDGHNFNEIIKAIEKAKENKENPTAILAHTIKGKGIDFMENNAGWHGKAPNEEEYKNAMAQLV